MALNPLYEAIAAKSIILKAIQACTIKFLTKSAIHLDANGEVILFNLYPTLTHEEVYGSNLLLLIRSGSLIWTRPAE
jgi:hypothetical protein